MSPNMEKKRANRLQTAYILSRTLVSLSILAGSPSRTKECITGYPECKLTFMMSEKSVSWLQCWLSWPWILSIYLTLHFFSKFVSRANNSKIYWPNEFPRKQGFLGPLLLKSYRVWGWFIPKTFQGLHFLFSRSLIWRIAIWTICLWNKFEEKAQCDIY